MGERLRRAGVMAVAGLAAGVVGLVLGLTAATTGPRLLAALAGAGALVAGYAGWRAAQDRRPEVAAEPDPPPSPAPETVPSSEPNGLVAPNGLTDPDTELFNERFFRVTLESRIAAARRHLRPVTIALIEVREGVRDGDPRRVSPGVVAEGLRQTLRSADTACRLDDGRFSLILEDTPENGAVWTVERVRRRLASDNPHQTLWAGVACYPAHSFDADDLLNRAEQALDAALHWQQDRIEVATSEV